MSHVTHVNVHMCDMTQSSVRHDSFLCATRVIHSCCLMSRRGQAYRERESTRERECESEKARARDRDKEAERERQREKEGKRESERARDVPYSCYRMSCRGQGSPRPQSLPQTLSRKNSSDSSHDHVRWGQDETVFYAE